MTGGVAAVARRYEVDRKTAKEAMLRRGVPLRGVKVRVAGPTVTLAVQVPKRIRVMAKEKANAADMTMAAWIARLIEQV